MTWKAFFHFAGLTTDNRSSVSFEPTIVSQVYTDAETLYMALGNEVFCEDYVKDLFVSAGALHLGFLLAGCPSGNREKANLYSFLLDWSPFPDKRLLTTTGMQRWLGDSHRDPTLTLLTVRSFWTFALYFEQTPGVALVPFLWDRAWAPSESWQIWNLVPCRFFEYGDFGEVICCSVERARQARERTRRRRSVAQVCRVLLSGLFRIRAGLISDEIVFF